MKRESWLEWRKKGLGASDAPTVMGVSPWSTPYKLWCEKLSTESPEDNGNWATQRGNDLEPIARARYELQAGLEFPATLATHKDYDFLRASLDGFNGAENIILEIKCPGSADHATALDGKVPEKYYPQLQHQLLVTGAKECHYVSYDGSDSLALVVVKPDLDYICGLVLELTKFWNLVKTKTPPELTDKDAEVIEAGPVLDLASRYVDLDAQAKAIEAEMKDLKERIIKETKHPRTLIGRLSVTKSYRVGAVDYAAVPQLEGVDLDAYRKKGTSSVTFTIKKA